MGMAEKLRERLNKVPKEQASDLVHDRFMRAVVTSLADPTSDTKRKKVEACFRAVLLKRQDMSEASEIDLREAEAATEGKEWVRNLSAVVKKSLNAQMENKLK